MKKLYFLLFVTFAGCNYPKDPHHSFEKAKENRLRVGAIVNPPFVTREDGSIGGSEIKIIKDFAKGENLKLKIEEGSESDLVEKLEKYEVDIIAGGFDKKSIWKKKAGLTTPYDKKHVFFIPKGENRLLQQLESFILEKVDKP
ncbi:transporter substrate-binding domain-containing protein [Zunongwangia sp. F363]|uniref:Transporter substrate-binding domain-containing protein n=1 Tax=Autumnicola tepida TaxID=3075595 RepID=A0ABU3CCN3_9FLAO|nr:transporter substrate-binding domain-containing protein [Zunongwangia sp. F363]MDT0644071.1 transporter substrate-binding domain-containing protein [Zunongwangia sp. F363]